MFSVGLAGRPSGRQVWHKNIDIVIVSDTIHVISVELCMMVLLIALHCGNFVGLLSTPSRS